MNFGSLLLLGGLGFLGVKAISGKSSSSSASGAKTGGLVTCTDAAKDCAALMACAGPILAKATAADTVTLTKMLSKATALDCTDVVKLINKKLADLGLGGVGVKTSDPSADYSILHNIGGVNGANVDDMLIVVLTDSTASKKYVMPLIFSGGAAGSGTAIYEKALASIALAKFKASPAATLLSDPTALLGAGAITLGAPPDLKDGTAFAVNFAGPFLFNGDVLAVVTADQMKTGLSSSTTSSSFAKSTSKVTGEEDPMPMMGRRAFGGNSFSGNFGSKSRFGTASIGG